METIFVVLVLGISTLFVLKMLDGLEKGEFTLPWAYVIPPVITIQRLSLQRRSYSSPVRKLYVAALTKPRLLNRKHGKDRR